MSKIKHISQFEGENLGSIVEVPNLPKAIFVGGRRGLFVGERRSFPTIIYRDEQGNIIERSIGTVRPFSFLGDEQKFSGISSYRAIDPKSPAYYVYSVLLKELKNE